MLLLDSIKNNFDYSRLNSNSNKETVDSQNTCCICRDRVIGLSLINYKEDATGNLYKNIRNVGIKKVEVFFENFEAFISIKKKLSNYDISIQSVHAKKDIFYQDDCIISAYLNEIEKLCSLSPEVFVLFHPNGEALQQNLSRLSELTPSICFENTIEDADKLITLVNFSKNFGLVLDVSHCSYFPSHMLLLNNPNIRYIHMRGYSNGQYTLLDKSDHHHKMRVKYIVDNMTGNIILENNYHSFQEIVMDYIYVKHL